MVEDYECMGGGTHTFGHLLSGSTAVAVHLVRGGIPFILNIWTEYNLDVPPFCSLSTVFFIFIYLQGFCDGGLSIYETA